MASVPSTPPIPGQRTLAAIVFTDVVGFSAHMQKDEETTLRLLKQDFDTMRDLCTQHEGSVLKTTGDGLLMYYASAVQAVASALAIQRTFAELAKSRPTDKNLMHRVGIHLGDVFVDKEDVMGDGVNIAARLQAEAEPGGICISQTVYHVVRNKLALQVTRLGPRELKNISQAIPIYKLLLKAQSIEEAAKNRAAFDDGSSPPLVTPKISSRAWLIIVAGLLLAILALLGWRAWTRHKQAVTRAEREQKELNERIWETTELSRQRIIRTLADWRTELKNKRSRALEEYNLTALAQDLNDPASPVVGKPEARVRAEVLQRIQVLFGWMDTHLQRYSAEKPLVVSELTGTAPKEFRVYMRPDRRLYYVEGGATLQRNRTDLRPSVLAAIVAAAIIQADPLPSKEVVQGAVAFGSLYNLPELRATLEQGRAQRVRP